jgi:hypothetical protein
MEATPLQGCFKIVKVTYKLRMHKYCFAGTAREQSMLKDYPNNLPGIACSGSQNTNHGIDSILLQLPSCTIEHPVVIIIGRPDIAKCHALAMSPLKSWDSLP